MATPTNANILPDTLALAHARILELEAQLKQKPGGSDARFAPLPVSILESITDAFSALDQEFRYVWVNAEAERLLQIPAADLLGRCIWEVFPDIAGSIVEEKCREAVAQQKPLEFEHLFASWGRWFFDKIYPMENGGVAIFWREITDRKNAEAQLRRQARELEQVHDAIVATNLNGEITRWNHGAERIFGYGEIEAMGQHFQMLCFAEDRAHISAKLRQPLLRDTPQESELRVRRKSGEERYIRLSLSLLHDEAGAAYGILSVAVDITAQKRTEQALRASEERFRLASRAVEGIVYDWHPQKGVVHRSGSLETMIGISVEEAEATANWWQERVHPADAGESSLNVISRLPKDKSQFEAEFRFRHADGHWVYLCDRGFVMRDQRGEPERVVGNTYDITDRKRLESALQESNKELKFQAHILEATNDAVIALDPDLCIRYCNAAAERMYGVSLAEVIGQPLPAMHGYAWLAAEDEQRFLADWAERGSWVGEYIHVLKDGSKRVVQSTVNKLTTEAGGGMVAVIRDITDRKQAELRMQNQAAQLARANDDLLHFAYAVSHDLQAPLRTITSFSQLLALKCKQNLDERAGEFIQWIVDASTRMDAMLRDLLQFAKTAGAEVVLSEQVALEDTFATAMESLRNVVAETQAVVTHDALPNVAGDGGQLVQLFQNLLGNALKYRKLDRQARIAVSAHRADGEWVIAVRDNGIGFEAKDAERIFDVFQRLHGKEFSGTGIGLTICKRIVERRGGRIWAEGAPGEGATFWFTIPDSTAAIRAAPPMEWTRLPAALENGPAPYEAQLSSRHFDEIFKAFDLAQALVRRLDGKVLIWTKGAQRLFGWTETEVLGEQFHSLIATEFPLPQPAVAAALLRDGEWAGELKAAKKDGSIVWLASHMVLYRDGSGRPESVIEVHNDITALKKADEAARQKGNPLA